MLSINAIQKKKTNLLKTLKTILQESSRLVKLFVSSRDNQNIIYHLQNYPNLNIASNRNINNITSFIKDKTQNLIRKKKLLQYNNNQKKLIESIINKITKRANNI